MCRGHVDFSSGVQALNMDWAPLAGPEDVVATMLQECPRRFD